VEETFLLPPYAQVAFAVRHVHRRNNHYSIHQLSEGPLERVEAWKISLRKTSKTSMIGHPFVLAAIISHTEEFRWLLPIMQTLECAGTPHKPYW
jgi:hypothetical protein